MIKVLNKKVLVVGDDSRFVNKNCRFIARGIGRCIFTVNVSLWENWQADVDPLLDALTQFKESDDGKKPATILILDVCRGSWPAVYEFMKRHCGFSFVVGAIGSAYSEDELGELDDLFLADIFSTAVIANRPPSYGKSPKQ